MLFRSRIINVELIYFAIATAFVFSLLNDKFKKATIPLFLLFSILLIADNYYYEGMSYRTDKAVSQARVNKLLEQTNTIPEGAVISYEPYELPENCVFYQLDGMLTAQAKNLKTVNGYTATCPKEYVNYWNDLNSKARIEWFAAKRFSIDTVYVLH